MATSIHGALWGSLASSFSRARETPLSQAVVGSSRGQTTRAGPSSEEAAAASDQTIEVTLEGTDLGPALGPQPHRASAIATIHGRPRPGVRIAPQAPLRASADKELTAAPFAGVTVGGIAQIFRVELAVVTKKAFARAALSLPESKRATRDLFREPAQKRDRDLGLGPEAPVLRALCSATFASVAPVRGRAVFRAVADDAGMIVGIEVVECDGETGAWAQTAELARSGLAGTTLRMPPHASRTEMRVEITSAWKIPSGHDSGTDVSFFGEQTSKGEGVESPKVAILDVLPKIHVIKVSRELKIPVVIVDPDIFSVKGDAANAGAKPRRVVHAHLLDSKVL